MVTVALGSVPPKSLASNVPAPPLATLHCRTASAVTACVAYTVNATGRSPVAGSVTEVSGAAMP